MYAHVILAKFAQIQFASRSNPWHERNGQDFMLERALY